MAAPFPSLSEISDALIFPLRALGAGTWPSSHLRGSSRNPLEGAADSSAAEMLAAQASRGGGAVRGEPSRECTSAAAVCCPRCVVKVTCMTCSRLERAGGAMADECQLAELVWAWQQVEAGPANPYLHAFLHGSCRLHISLLGQHS